MVKPPLETPNTAVTAVEIPLVPEIINGQTASVRSKAPTVKHSRSIKWELSVTANMVYFTLSISGRDLWPLGPKDTKLNTFCTSIISLTHLQCRHLVWSLWVYVKEV